MKHVDEELFELVAPNRVGVHVAEISVGSTIAAGLSVESAKRSTAERECGGF